MQAWPTRFRAKETSVLLEKKVKGGRQKAFLGEVRTVVLDSTYSTSYSGVFVDCTYCNAH